MDILSPVRNIERIGFRGELSAPGLWLLVKDDFCSKSKIRTGYSLLLRNAPLAKYGSDEQHRTVPESLGKDRLDFLNEAF